MTVIPLTSVRENKLADDILIAADSSNCLKSDSIIKVYCLASLDYSRLIKKIGRADQSVLNQIKQYLKKHFEI